MLFFLDFEATLANATVKIPSGTFWCKRTRGEKTIQMINFETCDDAINWLLANIIHSKEPELIHRDRIMVNIMKAIRKNSKYCNYYWGRIK